jgi:glycerol-3-phosphate dehydrogenase
LRRDPSAAQRERHDLIVIGGGIYGAMTALEAARRGLRPLLLERDDYGGATSWNSHRIVHGGLRYLQRLDLGRFFTSVRERRWFLQHFPELVAPLPCLMPLYGEGLRRSSVMRVALATNHLLSRHRNENVRSDRRLESGGVMTREETLALFPTARTEGLQGGAFWYDAVMTDSQRVLMETLRWACAAGARCLNYMEVTGLELDGGRVRGVRAVDRTGDAADGRGRDRRERRGGDRTGDRAAHTELAFEAEVVVNCAGPWVAALAGTLADRDTGGADDRDAELFSPSLAFNLLFERPAPSEVAVGVSAPGAGSHTWFLYARAGLLYAGTAHCPIPRDATWPAAAPPRPTNEQLDEAIEQINAAVPGLELRRHQVARMYSGLLPAQRGQSASLVRHPVIRDHGTVAGAGRGAVAGLFSVSGVKYTTARDVAEQVLRRAFEPLPPIREDAARPAAALLPKLPATGDALDRDTLAALQRLADEEAAIEPDDLLLRRGGWADDPRRAEALARTVASLLGRG